MMYPVPDEWTEEMLANLPDEDDRYEYKSGLLIDKFKSSDENGKSIEESLAKEIGALVNSFGGTLFLGVKDKTKEIDGCPAIIKGRETTKEWLEKVIPSWFEFRLYSFRINYVRLTDETRLRIGADREVICIDLMESGHIPHQTKFDQHYYYREGSQSCKAPHHYLAYVHGAKSPTMSETVRKWCVEFLNPAIELLRNRQDCFRFKSFELTNRDIKSGVIVPIMSFFPIVRWMETWGDGNLAGKQFFFNYPGERTKFKDLAELAIKLDQDCLILAGSISDNKLLEDASRTWLLAKNRQTAGYILPSDHDEMMHEFAGEFGLSLTNLGKTVASREFSNLIGNMCIWHLLGIEVFVAAEFQRVFSFAEDLSKDLLSDNNIEMKFEAVKSSFAGLDSAVKSLLDDLDLTRDELAATHNTSYS